MERVNLRLPNYSMLLVLMVLIVSIASFTTVTTASQTTASTTNVTGPTATTTMPSSSSATAATTTTIHQSIEDGFRVAVPNGWVVADLDNSSPQARVMERGLGFAYLAQLCPQSEAIQGPDGTYACSPEGTISARILRFGELLTRPELAAAVQENGTITTPDFYAFVAQLMEEIFGIPADFSEVNFTDTSVNVIDPQTNQTMETAPASYVEVTYTDELNRPVNREFLFLALTNDANTGYFILPTVPGQSIEEGQEQQPPQEISQVFDSFELLLTSSATTTPLGEVAPQPSPPITASELNNGNNNASAQSQPPP